MNPFGPSVAVSETTRGLVYILMAYTVKYMNDFTLLYSLRSTALHSSDL